MAGEERIDYLYFPQKLKRSKEIIQGLGKKEMIKVIVTTAILQIGNLVLYLIKQDVFVAAIYFLITTATMYGLFAKLDEGNTSFADQLKFMLRRMQSPSRYKYFYLDEWYLELEREAKR